MIGLGTYAFFWRMSDRVEAPMTLGDAFAETKELGLDLFQICDHAPLESMTDTELRALARRADELGIALQIGTRGIEPARLERFLAIAEILGARLVRSMFRGDACSPAPDCAVRWLADAIPAYERAGVTLALETYEQVATTDLVDVVERVGSDRLGICLDPANVVARLESPRACVEAAAAHTTNVHVKDFAFDRQPGWVGFTYSGAPMGEGLHDYDHLLAIVDPRGRGIDEIVEHWLPWQGDALATVRTERDWTRRTIDHLRRTP
ncbi:sugar phosphate isomerase/epimerase family protein [Microbacterium karelineae]|uniref:sugar phosphate isomerase/epimerase family protein n=1 Tax=Microbacterium karelineae TaxID=2654283 RepID=UPI0012E9DDB7|nr:sugar phosphate isomerase/epimerase family protein [Microbacterium karelineae]